MNTNPLLGQVLGGLFGAAMSRRAGGLGGGRMGGGLGGGLGGAALGSVLGGVLGGARRGGGMGVPAGRGGMLAGNRGALLMMLLPYAMSWVKRNGGMGAVLKRFQQKGYSKQAQSWVATGANDSLDEQALEQVMGREELEQIAQRFGVPEQEVAQAFAEIMPEMVHQLTPQGQLPDEADDVLEEGRQVLEKEIEDVQHREVAPS